MADDEKKPHEIKLGEPYDELAKENIYSDKVRVGAIFAANNKKDGENFLRLLSESHKPAKGGAKWKKNYGFNLYKLAHVDKVIYFLKQFAAKLGWNAHNSDDAEKLKAEIHDQKQQIIEYGVTQERLKEKYEKTITKYVEMVKAIGKTRLPDFKADVNELKKKIKDAKTEIVPEADLQKFLYSHSWIFGLEYITSEPQKLSGTNSKFDFYLERYNKTNDIVEIKLLSNKIVNKDGSISAVVVQAVDQIIGYMESSIATAHSRVRSEEEGIKELRPQGIVIIGSDKSDGAIKKLRQWNYQFAHIRLMTYEELLEQGKAIIEKIEVKDTHEGTKCV